MSIVMEWHPIDRDEVADLLDADEEGLVDWLEDPIRRPFDVDESWHALHVVLTGAREDSDHPLSAVVFGGEEFGPDLGDGPSRYLTADEVRQLAAALDELELEDVRARVDFGKLAGLDAYPDAWTSGDEPDDDVALLTDAFEAVRAGFHKAADHGQAMVITPV